MAARVLTLTRDSLSVDLTTAPGNDYPTGPGLWLGAAPSLFGAPNPLVDEFARVALPGSVITVRTHKARDIVIGVLARVEDDGGDLEEVLTDLASLVDPVQSSTPVRLTFTRGDAATTRWIDGVCVQGASGLSVRYEGARHARAQLLFRCGDPYWHSGSAATVTVDATPETADAYDVAEAYDLAVPYSQSLWQRETLTVTGDLPMRPVWEIDGPATNVVIVNETSGESIQWSGALADGETLTINTQLGEQAVTVDGVNAWSGLDARSTLWAFTPGTDRPYATNIEGGGGNTEARLMWLPSWLTC